MIRRLYINGDDEEPSEFHERILKNWESENDLMQKVFDFFENFNKPQLIKYLVKSEYFKNIIQFGLICPKNSKVKFTFIKFLKKNLNSLSVKEYREYFCDYLFSQFLSPASLSLAIENSANSVLFFEIIMAFLVKYSLHKVDTDKLRNVATFMYDYIVEFTKEKKLSSDSYVCDNIFKGFCGILRLIALNNYKIKCLLIEKNLINILLQKCLFPNNSKLFS